MNSAAHARPGVTTPADADECELSERDGRYLRLGIALQLALEVEEEPYTARALDLAISQFSGRPLAELASVEGRNALKAELLEKIKQAYDGEVLDLYYTDFVTQ